MNIPRLITHALLLSICSISLGDTTLPYGEVTQPAAYLIQLGGGSTSFPGNLTPNEITDINGFVADDESGIDFVRVQVVRFEDNDQSSFWNGQAWQAQPIWLNPLFDGENWTLLDVDLTQVEIYAVRLTIRDLAGNRSLASQNDISYIRTVNDTVDPTGFFKTPDAYLIANPGAANEQPGNELTVGSREVSLRASDDLIGVDTVLVQAYHVESGEYWNGTQWQSAPAWRPTIESGTLGLDRRVEEKVDFDRAGHYWVRMCIFDRAGNHATGAESQKILLRIVQDTVPPIAYSLGNIRRTLLPDRTWRLPGRTTLPGVRDQTGFAIDDGVGVESVRVQIERRSAGNSDYWNGSQWQAAPIWVLSTGTQTENDWRWRVNDVDMQISGEYVIRTVTTDLSGNRSTAAQNPIAFLVVQ